jgi:hypothetical protein
LKEIIGTKANLLHPSRYTSLLLNAIMDSSEVVNIE